MKKFLFLLLLSLPGLAQKSVENSSISSKNLKAEPEIIDVSIKTGVDNPDMETLFQFENISQTEFSFNGEALKGKYYVLTIKEFLNGEQINTSTLFDERGNEHFKIDSSQTTFKLLSKIGKDDIKLWIKGSNFGSKQSYFPVNHNSGRYVAKDFFGSRERLKEDIQRPFHIMAIITPTKNPDGSGSYCRVAQSEIDPEQFGNEFDIPHYYLIEIEFTD